MTVAGQRAVVLVDVPLVKTMGPHASKAAVVVEAEGAEVPHAAEEPVHQGAEALIPVVVAVIQGVGEVVILVEGAVVRRRRQAPPGTGIAVARLVEDTIP